MRHTTPLDSVEPTSMFSTCQGRAAVWLRPRQPRGPGPQQLFPTKLSAFPDRFFPGFCSAAQSCLTPSRGGLIYFSCKTWFRSMNEPRQLLCSSEMSSASRHGGGKPQAGGPLVTPCHHRAQIRRAIKSCRAPTCPPASGVMGSSAPSQSEASLRWLR